MKYKANLPDNPTVTIGLLSYNRGDFLKKTMIEVEKAEYPYELIVNDDGSDIMATNSDWLMAALRLNRISTLILNPPGHNEGVGRSINKCFEMGSGDILIKMDTDLDLRTGWLQKVVEIMKNNNRIGLLGLCFYHHEPVDYEKTKLQDCDDHTIHTHILGSVFAVRRDVYEHFGISSYSHAFAEDWELMKKLEADPYWYNALPVKEIAHNYGMGLNTSTVAVEDDDGEVTTKSIHDGLKIIGEKNE